MEDPQAAAVLAATRVFEMIVDRFISRSQDIARFAATRYSFEEWCNWEAYAAAAATGLEATPRPRYCDLSDPASRGFGDVSVVVGNLNVLVEVGLVHDGTGDKWRGKLELDTQKLQRPLIQNVVPLQLILLVSTRNIAVDDQWQRWLAKVACWQRPTLLCRDVQLPPNGQMILRGWSAP